MKIKLDEVNKVKEFLNVSKTFPSKILITSDIYKVDAKSIMGIFSLDLSKPIELTYDAKYNFFDNIFKKWEVKAGE